MNVQIIDYEILSDASIEKLEYEVKERLDANVWALHGPPYYATGPGAHCQAMIKLQAMRVMAPQ